MSVGTSLEESQRAKQTTAAINNQRSHGHRSHQTRTGFLLSFTPLHHSPSSLIIRAKKFWLMRSARKPEGVLWVPNSMLVFAICGSIYSVLQVVQTALQYRWFTHGDEPTALWALLLLGRLPVLTASTLATLSVCYSLSPRSSFTVHRHASVFFEPMVFNTVVVGSPLIQAATIIVPTCIAHRSYVRSIQMYEAWLIKFAHQSELSQDMLIDAQRCWYALYPTFRWASLTFLIWTVWYAFYFVCYSFLSGRLVCVLRAQLKHSHHHATRLNPQVSPPLHNIDTEAASPNGSDGSSSNGQCSPEPFHGSRSSPKGSKARIVRQQAPQGDPHNHLRYLRLFIYNVVLQMISFGTAFSLYCFLSAYAAAMLPGSIETSQIEKPWVYCIKVPLLTAGYATLFSNINFLLLAFKRSRNSEPLVPQSGGLGGEANACNNSQRLSPTGADHLGGDKGGRSITPFFDPETLHRDAVQRPALAITTASTQHDLEDPQPSSPVRGLGLDFGGHRRFSQTIIIDEEPEDIESVHDSRPNDNDSPSASPKSTRFALLPSLSGTTISPEDSGSRSRVHSVASSSFTLPSPPYRMRSLSRNLRSSKPA